MHTNHRRINKYKAKQHGDRGFWTAYSLREWRRQASRDRRARERHLIENGRHDELLNRYPRDIAWKYW